MSRAPLLSATFTLVFLSVVWAASGCRGPRSPETPPRVLTTSRATPASPRRAAVHFTDVTTAAGIRFHHTNGGFGRKYLPETMGSGCAFLDFDGDGWLDILLLNGRPLRPSPQSKIQNPKSKILTLALYRNNHDGTFADVTRGSGLDVPLYAMGCCVGDYDNDGRADIFITACMDPGRLFHNDGGGKFHDVTVRAGVGDRRWGTSCAWVDYDNDGWLDLFVSHYLHFLSFNDDKFCTLVAGRKSYCPPGAYAGESCLLYHNRGDGTFRDVSGPTGISRQVGNSLGVTIIDWDNDGWPDIAVANDESPNYLFHNVRGPGSTGRRFEEIGVETGFAVAEGGKPKAGMGIGAADYANNGSLGILVSNFTNEGLSFYRREGDLLSEDGFATGFAGPSLLTLGFGLFFFDIDNRGLKDAFVANGHVNDDISLLQSNLGYAERHLLFRNRGDGSFEEIGREAGAPFSVPRVSRGAAYGDYDNDGRVDILVSNNNGPAELLRSDGTGAGNWLEIDLKGDGAGGANRSGIGARVRLKTGATVQTDWVRSGSSYLSASMLRRHFGLGRASRADWVEVTWPGGRRQRVERVAANQRIMIEAGKSGYRRLPSGML